MSRLLFALPLVALALLAAVFARGLRRDPAVLPSELIDRPLPALTLASLRPGQPAVALASLRGPMLVNVFASWCAACPAEHPALRAIAREVPLIGIDWKDDRAAARAWLARLGDPYSAVGTDPGGNAAIELGVTGAPETFLIDARGRVIAKQTGAMTAEVWQDFRRRLRS